jgi:hypothetical protein
MTVHPENIVSGVGDSSEAASNHSVESGNRRGKSGALAMLFDRTVSFDSSSRVVSLSGLLASPFGIFEKLAKLSWIEMGPHINGHD